MMTMMLIRIAMVTYDDETCDGDDDMNGTSSNFCRLLKLVAASVSKLD